MSSSEGSGGEQQSSKRKSSIDECSTCGAPVSPFIKTCPFCGADVKRRSAIRSFKLRTRSKIKKARMGARRVGTQASRRMPKQMPRAHHLDPETPYAVGFLVLANVFGFIAFDSRGELFNDPGAFSVEGVKSGDWSSLITYQFLHTGILELLFSVFLMFIFAIMVERRFGHLAALLCYVLSGIGGGLLAVVFSGSPDIVAGSLVSTLGLMGAWLVSEWRPRGEIHSYPIPAGLLLIAVIFAYGVLQDGLDIWTLAGGLITGSLFIFLVDTYQNRA